MVEKDSREVAEREKDGKIREGDQRGSARLERTVGGERNCLDINKNALRAKENYAESRLQELA